MSAKPKFAVILAGCGVYDGSEIHEAVLTFLAIDRNGGTYQCFAPDMEQMHVINHTVGEVCEETRNVLIESSRIARGAIQPLSSYKADDFDAIVFPGGYGVAKNLCTFAINGSDCTVQVDAENAIISTYKAGKPIVALCISPALIAKVIEGVHVTIGNNADAAGAIADMGGTHHELSHGEICVDKSNKLITTPCYMLDATVSQVADGIDAAVKATLDIINAA